MDTVYASANTADSREDVRSGTESSTRWDADKTDKSEIRSIVISGKPVIGSA